MKNDQEQLPKKKNQERRRTKGVGPLLGVAFVVSDYDLCRKTQNKKSVFGSHNLSVNQARFFQILENPTG